jgi:hypothetical protein
MNETAKTAPTVVSIANPTFPEGRIAVTCTSGLSSTEAIYFAGTFDGGSTSTAVKGTKDSTGKWYCDVTFGKKGSSFTWKVYKGSNSGGSSISTSSLTPADGTNSFTGVGTQTVKFPTATYIYFKPNSDWLKDGARFAAYFYEGAKYEWVDMTSVDGVYRCVVPEGYSNLLYGRMNPSSQTNGFTQNTQIWNQTKDLTVQTGTKNCYVVHIEQWSKEEGLWTSVDEAKRILYLLPQAEWDKDNARFAAYFFGNGEKWEDMKKFTTYKYYVIPPAGYPNVIFCRMNGNATANNWNNKWNQTVDLTIPTNGNNTCTISNFWNNKASGSWSKK